MLKVCFAIMFLSSLGKNKDFLSKNVLPSYNADRFV